jgi:hypothetical protein
MASGRPDGSLWYVLNKGSQTVTALVEIRPFCSAGLGTGNILSAEHSSASPAKVLSSKHFLYAATMVDTGVRLIEGKI